MNKITHTQKPAALQIGQFFRHKCGETFLLGRVESGSFTLMCLDDGDSWHGAREAVEETFFNQIEDFELIVSPFTITPSNK